jgi:hypothetical protein
MGKQINQSQKGGHSFWRETSVAWLSFDLTDRFAFSSGTLRECPDVHENDQKARGMSQ